MVESARRSARRPLSRANKVKAVAARLIGFCALVAPLLVLGPTLTASSATPLQLTPSANIAPRPDFLSSGPCQSSRAHQLSCANPCFSGAGSAITVRPYDNSRACTTYILAAINHARAVEGVAPMMLPNNWYTLSADEQMFVLTNLERTARGLPPYQGLVSALNHSAAAGAARNVDPWFVSGMTQQGFTSILADASPSPLAADYVWMYNDGWGGTSRNTSNVDCTSPGASGCWGHRHNILGVYLGPYCHDCQMGAAYRNRHGTGVYAEIFVRPQHQAAPASFTWTRDVVPHLSAAASSSTTSSPAASSTP